MMKFLLCLLLAIGPAWTAKLPVIPGVKGGRDRFAAANDIFSSYLPPEPSPSEPCVHPVETTTVFVTSTSTVFEEQPGPREDVVTVTSTELVPTTIFSTTSSFFDDISTVISTVFETAGQTVVETSTFQAGTETQTVTDTVTSVSTVLDFQTITSTEFTTLSTVITSFQLSTEFVETTYTQTEAQDNTRFVTETQPGSTVFVTRTSTVRDVETQTIPPQTFTETSTVINTSFETSTQQLPAETSTVFDTVTDTETSTVLSTFTQLETQFVTNTQFETQFSTITSYETQEITETVTNSDVVTSTVLSTLFSTEVIPTTITEGRESTSVVTIPAETIFDTITVTSTTSIIGDGIQLTTGIVITETSTNFITKTVGGGRDLVTITATTTQPCDQQTGYNYQEPQQHFDFNSAKR